MAEKKPNAVPRPDQDVRRTTTHSGVIHVRTYPPGRFTVVGNHLLQHRELSLIAIGLATHILSLPDGAAVDIRSLVERFPEGRDRIAFALRELEAHGYLERVREHAETGRIATRTYAHHTPLSLRGNIMCDRGAAPRARTRGGVPRPSVGARDTPQGDDRGDGGSAVPPASPAAPEPVEPVEPPASSGQTEPEPEPVASAAASAESPAPRSSAGRINETNETDVSGAGTGRPYTPGEEGVLDRRHDKAVALLAGLRRTDDRLTLSRRDVHRLAPAVTAWFDVGATAATVHRTLTADLPPGMRSPAGVLAYRLREQLPPPLPPREAPLWPLPPARPRSAPTPCRTATAANAPSGPRTPVVAATAGPFSRPWPEPLTRHESGHRGAGEALAGRGNAFPGPTSRRQRPGVCGRSVEA
ncbi:helix-turn-helix domain-containing protein [Streptomyces sp. NBC_00820]|uniref:helix-turn-helix domain-containing protein n=1 Tax=Streptomyces sp. NBC_00820 TaxID=2975842 RepID=UPI003FA6920A